VLYAAALFIVGRIPLENIYLMGTPLHSQNFIDVNEGILTNNRRIVTKKMWFNGTSMTTKARRALENEKITLVSHISGYIHHIFEKATINLSVYQIFSEKLKQFLTSEFSPEVFINFLRYHMKYKKCFQYKRTINNRDCYIGLETIFEYEHSSKISFSGPTRETFMNEIDDEEFSLTLIDDRLVIQDVEVFLEKNKGVDMDFVMDYFLKQAKSAQCSNEKEIQLLFRDLADFLSTKPQLPATNKQFIQTEALPINTEQDRLEIIKLISEKADESEVALLSLYAFRDMGKISWDPFIKAAFERNPVSLVTLKGKTAEGVYKLLSELPNESIYDGQRLAQPDEVWNFGRGDGTEKAFLLANFLYNEMDRPPLNLVIENDKVILEYNNAQYNFHSTKGLVKKVNLS
jgi:hypothetical protein